MMLIQSGLESGKESLAGRNNRWCGSVAFHLRGSIRADPGGRAVEGVSLRALACSDCEFESCRGHGCLLCCVLSGRGPCIGLITLPEKSFTKCGVCECDQVQQ